MKKKLCNEGKDGVDQVSCRESTISPPTEIPLSLHEDKDGNIESYLD